MNSSIEITAAIVLYNNNLEVLNKSVFSFLKIPRNKKLYLIDNSPTNILESHFKIPEIEYIYIGNNLGFGKAHNLVLDKINSNFHLILNPDVEFDPQIINELIGALTTDNEVSFITPKVMYPNKQFQFVCRKHPTLLDLINRKLKISKNFLIKNEYRNRDLTQPFYPDFIHGCFMLFKTEHFKFLKGFDERFFLYMEDADICRKINKMQKKILYYPKVAIVHHHQKGSSKGMKLFLYHLSSAFKYFLKWGF